MKEYKLQTGEIVEAPDNCCLFCDHCTDLFYDWGGIWWTHCDIDKDVVIGSKGECEYFVDDIKSLELQSLKLDG